jgi:anti-anti-sigma factor
MSRGSADHFRLDLDWQDDSAIVAVHGILDVGAVAELSERLSEIVKVTQPRRLVVDLAKVAYTDQPAAAALAASAQRRRHPRRLRGTR